MGLFSSKYVTTVGTSVSRAVEDDLIVGSVGVGTTKALFQDGNIADYVMEELVSSLGVRAERMYTYAEQHYAHGLPSGEVFSSTQGRAQVEAIIESIEGQQVLIEYSHFGPGNALHLGWLELVNQYGYNQATNQIGLLTTQKGNPVYLKNMVVVVPASQLSTIDPAVLESWGTPASAGYTSEQPASSIETLGLGQHSGYITSSTVTDIEVRVTYLWQTNPTAIGSVQEETLAISLSSYSDDADYFQAKYLVNGQAKYWIYENDSGVYPSLDSLYVGAPVVNGSYFPFIYFRYNKQATNQDTTSAAYLSSKKALKYLNMDYDVIADSIAENPDIADVEQAMLVFAVAPVSSNQIQCRYLFDYFDAMHYATNPTANQPVDQVLSRIFKFQRNSTKYQTVIQDRLFKMALGHDGIYKRLVAGSIGAVGTYSSEYQTSEETTEWYNSDTGLTEFGTFLVKAHVYKHQIASGLYEEVQVKNLKMTYYVFGNYTTTGDETDSILLIPVDRNISGTYSMADREVLYARSLHYVFNSRVVTKVRWYNTGVFKVLMIIISVIIMIYNPPAGLAALQLTGAALVIAAIVINIVIGFILQAAFRLFVKVFGTEIATALAIIAIIYGGFKMIQAGSVSGAPFATELLQISNGLSQAVIETKFSELIEQADELQLYIEEQTKSLETSKELLENSHLLSPFVIFGEKPQDFYNRTVHSGNIGTLGINAISSYVDIALTLPTLNDTVGEEIYG